MNPDLRVPLTTFSKRFSYDPRLPKEPIFEDAPECMRTAFLNLVLEPFTYGGVPADMTNESGRPLDVRTLINEFFGIMRQEADGFPDFTSFWDDLKSVVKSAEWFHFYDFVEAVGKNLKSFEGTFDYAIHESKQKFSFDAYRRKVNELFTEERIGWRLNDVSELVTAIPKSLSSRMSATAAMLEGGFGPARSHYIKAVRYVAERPLDPENAIKEITSAVESVGKVFYPKANTLGDVVAALKKNGSFPPLLSSMVEKFYAYASSEPAVRHGAAVPSDVVLADAEFCLHVGIALIRYLIVKHNSQQKNPATSV
jgi:hypothetical protein